MRHMARTFAALTVAATMAGACKKSAPPPAPPAPEVAVVKIEPKRVPTSYEFTGEVQPYRRVQVRSRVDGIDRGAPLHRGRHRQARPGALPHRPGAPRGRLSKRARALPESRSAPSSGSSRW